MVRVNIESLFYSILKGGLGDGYDSYTGFNSIEDLPANRKYSKRGSIQILLISVEKAGI
jgi:hypothetical protein